MYAVFDDLRKCQSVNGVPPVPPKYLKNLLLWLGLVLVTVWRQIV